MRNSRMGAEDESARGEYEILTPTQHLGPFVESDLGSSLWAFQRIRRLWPTVAFSLLGVGLMLAHHFFFSYINGKSIDSEAAELPSFLRDQNAVAFIGRTIAHAARAVFSMMIGTAFTQTFWETLRARSHSIRDIDALIKCGQSPFHPHAVRMLKTSLSLFLMSILASATAIIVIITPGSLTVVHDFQRTEPCIVSNVPDVMNLEFERPSDDTSMSVTNIYTSGTYLPPFLSNSTCVGAAKTCSYNVSFVGPVLDCIDISHKFNLSDIHPRRDNFSIIWSTSYPIGGTDRNDSIMGVTVLTQDLVQGDTRVNNCTAHSAVYDVGLTLEGSEESAVTNIWRTSVDYEATIPFYNVTTFLSQFVDAALSELEENLYASPNGGYDPPNAGLLGSFFVTTPTGNHTFNDNITHILTSYMQNISLSLLSGDIYTGFSNDTATNLLLVNANCSLALNAYSYNTVRLLSTYGIALAITVAVAAYGCWLALRNGIEKSLVISGIIQCALGAKLYFAEKMHEKSRIRLAHSSSKLLPPNFTVEEDEEDMQDVTPNPAGESRHGCPPKFAQLHRYSKLFWSSKVQTTGFLLAAIFCMVIHHLLNRYLHGRAPNVSLRGSRFTTWITNQSVVSVVGTGLAYAGQTFFVAAIYISSVQIFWRSLRSTDHTVPQMDALMKAQNEGAGLSTIHAARVSFNIPLLAVLMVLMSAVSVFAPGSIKVTVDFTQSQSCTVNTLRNLTALSTSNSSDYTNVLSTVMSLGTFLSPLNTCDLECAYSLVIDGPGLHCSDVTASTDYDVFAGSGPNSVMLYNATFQPPIAVDDETLRFFVQTWDKKRSIFQAVTCRAVMRTYTVVVSHSSTSIINVTSSQVLSDILQVAELGNFSGVDGNIDFSQYYVTSIMEFISGVLYYGVEEGGIIGHHDEEADPDPIQPDIQVNVGQMSGSLNALCSISLDGNLTWRENMSATLEDYAQNLTLSILSGQIFLFDSEDPLLLNNISTTCSYTSTAYEYTPSRLFLVYGVASSVTLLCTIWGFVSIHRNGVEESMDFSRFLRAVLNEDMFRWYAGEGFELNSVSRFRVEDTMEGSLVPVIEQDVDSDLSVATEDSPSHVGVHRSPPEK